MNLRNMYPLLDVEEFVSVTSTEEANALIRRGHVSVLAYTTSDGFGGSYAVFVLGKRRAATDRTLTDRPITDHDEFDQRHHG